MAWFESRLDRLIKMFGLNSNDILHEDDHKDMKMWSVEAKSTDLIIELLLCSLTLK